MPTNTQIIATNITTGQEVGRRDIVLDGNVQDYDFNPTDAEAALVSESDIVETLIPGATDLFRTRGVVQEPSSSGSSAPANAALSVDFENFTLGPVIQSELVSAFNIGALGYGDSINFEGVAIANDPLGQRGRVMAVTHIEGRGGSSNGAGGFRFRADFPPGDEYWLSYDCYFPTGWWQPLQLKMPAMITDTLLISSHDIGITPDPTTLSAFNARMQMWSNEGAQNNRGDNSLSSIPLDKFLVQTPVWCNSNDPTSLDIANGSTTNIAGNVNMPL